MSHPPTSNYPDMGEITTLRLELGRERDRANAFEAALTKAVQELIAKALQDYAGLKAENERLRASSFVTAVPSEDYERRVHQYNSIIDQQLSVIADLKAENERLKSLCDILGMGGKPSV